MQIGTYKESDIDALAKQLIDYIGDYRVVLLHGDLGTGKTTLVKSVAAIMGVKGEISSPTYSIVNEYELPHGDFYHMDLYRLESIEEVEDIGIEDYLFSGNWCWIEWPEMLKDILPKKFVKIEIERVDEVRRKIHIFKEDENLH